MVPKHQSRLANVLMVGGATPWIAVLGWVIAILLLNIHGRPPRIFMLDPIGMIGVMIVVYMCALLFAGIGVWWSFFLTQKHPELWTKKVAALRATVGLTIGIPLLWTMSSYISKFL